MSKGFIRFKLRFPSPPPKPNFEGIALKYIGYLPFRLDRYTLNKPIFTQVKYSKTLEDIYKQIYCRIEV